jgi:hypothetical protein
VQHPGLAIDCTRYRGDTVAMPPTSKPTRKHAVTATKLALGAAGLAAVWALLRSVGADEQKAEEPIAIAWARVLEPAKIAAEQRGADLLLWFRNREWEQRDEALGLGFRDREGEVTEHKMEPWTSLANEVFADASAMAVLRQRFHVLELAYNASIEPRELPPAFASLCQVGYGTGGRDAFLPPIVLADAGGRPFAVPGTYVQGACFSYVHDLLELVAVRERRDAAFAVAGRAQGVERAKALADGLAAMEPGLVVMCYRPELQTIVDLDADGSAGLRASHAKLLRDGRLVQGALEVHEIGLVNWEAIDPRRLRSLLERVVQRYADLPEVDQLARCYQARAEARLAFDEHGFALIANELEAARLLAPQSSMVPAIEQVLEHLEARRQRAPRRK